jgi:uncharacterized membrane protein
MAKISKTVEIAAPPERVFAFMTDPNNLPEIWPSMVEVSGVRSGADGSHSFDWVYKMAGVKIRGHADATVTEPRRRVHVENESGIPSTFEYLYEGSGNHTRFTMQVEYTIPGQVLGKLAEPIVRRINEHEADVLLQNLKARMELSAGETTRAPGPSL